MNPWSTIIAQIESLNATVDQSSQILLNSLNIKCPSTCNRCCSMPNIEASVAECLPTAIHIISLPDAQEIIEKIESYTLNTGQKLPCPLVTSTARNSGGCAVYEARPTLCRLYGSTSRRTFDKKTTPPKSKDSKAESHVLVGCEILKTQIADQVDTTSNYEKKSREALASSLTFEDVLQKIADIEPALGTVRVPIAHALNAAIQLVRLTDAPAEALFVPPQLHPLNDQAAL